MATPLVSGCVAVLRETLVKNGTPSPGVTDQGAAHQRRDRTVGAVLTQRGGHVAQQQLGFGRVNLTNSIIIPGPDPDAGFGEGGPLKQGDEETFEIDIPSKAPGDNAPTAAGATFKITLAWTDPPGAALQNDLDLIVVAADGTERHGNMAMSNKFDRVNNVEQVLWTTMRRARPRSPSGRSGSPSSAQPYAYAWRLS
jgi:hypothetical protein